MASSYVNSVHAPLVMADDEYLVFDCAFQSPSYPDQLHSLATTEDTQYLLCSGDHSALALPNAIEPFRPAGCDMPHCTNWSRGAVNFDSTRFQPPSSGRPGCLMDTRRARLDHRDGAELQLPVVDIPQIIPDHGAVISPTNSTVLFSSQSVCSYGFESSPPPTGLSVGSSLALAPNHGETDPMSRCGSVAYPIPSPNEIMLSESKRRNKKDESKAPKKQKSRHDSVAEQGHFNPPSSHQPHRPSISTSRGDVDESHISGSHEASNAGLNNEEGEDSGSAGSVRRTQRLARNRVAAIKSRAKTQAAARQLEVNEHEVRDRNEMLVREHKLLRDQIYILRSELLLHADCCPIIERYLTYSAKQISNHAVEVSKGRADASEILSPAATVVAELRGGSGK